MLIYIQKQKQNSTLLEHALRRSSGFPFLENVELWSASTGHWAKDRFKPQWDAGGSISALDMKDKTPLSPTAA